MTDAGKEMLAAILAMGVLHFTMMMWLYMSRMQAFKQAGVTPDTATFATMRKLPDWALNPAANYNNLTEAPPLFYTVIIVIVLLGQADAVNVVLAWLYVGIRVAHSLWQSLVNRISIRMMLFAASWFVLGAMIVRSGWHLLS
ncbi:MAPEG family protein [Asticcacaulis taihuensis]|uniref:MAPEG family protein n=1 Tax=Asticcacaulis taihuensis TaxID=260084 RepID=UPI0026F340EB|nr:MAPEG family protein [Asticcacaulis taihuensis]